MKKINVKKEKKFLFKFEIFGENHSPTRHLKYKVINLASSYKIIKAEKLHSTNLEQFIRRIKSPLTR